MGTGGRRNNAGRPAQHVKAEHCRSIDVRRWQRDGLLQTGRAGGWQWSDPDTGKATSSIGYQTNDNSVTLIYAIEGKPFRQVIWLTESPCNYGGTRKWFTCPICGERVAVLYLRASRFACRQCQRVAYASQSGDGLDRTWRKQSKAESKLGPNWERPKGMHATTRDRLLSVIWECEERRDDALSSFLESMFRRYPSLRHDPLLR